MLDIRLEDPTISGQTLQQQLHQGLVDAILEGRLPSHEPLPSTRDLASALKVSRNTVVLVYQRLLDDGYLTAVWRRGHFVNEQYIRQQLRLSVDTRTASLFSPQRDPDLWNRHLQFRPSKARNIVKPANWRDFPYPFIYGQVAPDKATISRWRDSMRLAGSLAHSQSWVGDQVDMDDPKLLEQIITRILPHRGLRAHPEQLLITIGAQNALFLVGQLLAGAGRKVGVEDPGYVDARNIFGATGADIVPLPIDSEGLASSAQLRDCDVVYTTPSHQCPTSVTMSLDRRLQIVERARQDDFIIVEDDYEHELNYLGHQRAALKSYDNSGHIIYIGSLTKLMFPGLRIGYILADSELIKELRALRRLSYRHPSAQDQRAMALFIGEGHLDAHLRRTRDRLSEKWQIMQSELSRQLPDIHVTATTGGSAVWVILPQGMDAWSVHREAAKRGVLVEPGDVHYANEDTAPRNRLRLGFAAIDKDLIAAGIGQLRDAIHAVATDMQKGTATG
ncbi:MULTISPECIES: PLP-dependent aminotransferase family protein [Thalassospira]|uniref:GntR family transcriptional regulator n=2 Tax=Thalassospira TaxID=168934 RepID=A0A367VZT4_9PROT|nr:MULTISPECIES: PLP-dependent aminotransferase family protein [Thalassospira]MDG4720103.1 PLP-dependent aminotransferase family protein [Thalassospira sp. FZY0004]RCK31777.1 GntR family transcriptional regulator [Thalassospira profundimaris]